MGVIQSSINNLLGTAVIAAKLTPGLEEAGAAKKAATYAKKAAKYASKETEGYTKMVNESGGEGNVAAHRLAEATFSGVDKAVEVAEKAQERAIEAAEKNFETNPSAKTKKKLDKAQFKRDVVAENAEEFWSLKSKYLAAEDAAEERLQLEQNRVRNSEFFRKPTQSLEQDLKEIGGNQ